MKMQEIVRKIGVFYEKERQWDIIEGRTAISLKSLVLLLWFKIRYLDRASPNGVHPGGLKPNIIFLTNFLILG